MAFILIADDDELIAEMASEVLIDAGHASGWVTSGEDAWALMKNRRPDLLLLDQDMPGITGVNLLRKLRGSSEFYDLPVIMFTAMSGAEDENRAIYAGAQDYIRKPFTPRALVDKIARTLAKRGQSHIDLRDRLARDSGFLRQSEAMARRII
ncbi:response regulator [Erythrobacter sp. THAF29]|uniref:response regulator n=1 Tax=Erythrobacter sp. THAF29 TaxID=2587851 RepID=UPI001268C52F|nr:response regulator [Erythrobacter sp. THAF29]QFT77608.1 Phosphate regulon transcriptional regulatory protein PhoB [Erythrobacter sp. THAF29]